MVKLEPSQCEKCGSQMVPKILVRRSLIRALILILGGLMIYYYEVELAAVGGFLILMGIYMAIGKKYKFWLCKQCGTITLTPIESRQLRRYKKYNPLYMGDEQARDQTELIERRMKK